MDTKVKKMKKILLIATFCLLHHTFLTSTAQTPVSYNDVLVIVNTNSQLSQDVGNYFKTQRGIPSQNVCALAMPTTEQIDSLAFLTIMNQIKNYMSSNGLTTTVNYIVTTQDVPLKIRRSGSVADLNARSGSFDGELCLMNSALEIQIGNAGRVLNPYRNSAARFSRSSFSNMYLVTRLAGYCYADIVGLIDRAVQPYRSFGKFVLDADPTRGLTTNTLNVLLGVARDSLTAKGFNVMYDATTEYITEQHDVLGYASWGSNEGSWPTYSWNAQPSFTWSPKALAETYVSTSGGSFYDSTFIEPTTGWQSMVADLIHENGVTGVKGYVWEPYSAAMAKVDILFNRWTTGYNLAESFYSASQYVGWMDVVIGDPKSLFASNGHLPVQLVSFSGSYLNSRVKLVWKTASEINNFGFEIERKNGNSWDVLGFVPGNGTVNVPMHYTFTDDRPMGDRNVYRLRQIDRDGASKYSGSIEVAAMISSDFTLLQNYPNPVVTSTSIPFSIRNSSAINADIVAIDGRVLATIAANETMTAGQHILVWNGTDMRGSKAPAGRYICRVTATGPDGTMQIRVATMTVL
jgi:uncharacterized protein (TIGR03790 family)